MRGYGALAGRYLKQQRRRSILTIIGIVLSVALISALGTMGQAVKDNAIANSIYEDGAFHITYLDAAPELAEQLKHHVLLDKKGLAIDSSTTEFEHDTFAHLYGINADGFDLLPIHLEEGRLPQAASEVVAEEWLLKTLPSAPTLGGSITLLDAGGNSADYQIVGILKNQRASQISRVSKLYTIMDDANLYELWENAKNTDASKKLQLFLTFKSGVDISESLAPFADLHPSFNTNHELLALIGESSDTGLNTALLVIFGTLIALVALSTIAVIYNAFHIAVLERIRQFGLLRTLGATPRQIRNLVLREAAVLSVIGIPLGLAVGWLGLWLALTLMMQGGMTILQMDNFKLTFHWWIMGLSVCVGLFAVFVAAWLPARKASSVSPVEAAKGAGSIVRESYRRFRIPSPLRLLGVEGRMASANIRRSKAKFRITTFSIAVSITLFVVFHYFTLQVLDITVDTSENTKIAYEIYPYSNGSDADSSQVSPLDQDRLSADQLERIQAIPGVENVYGVYSSFGIAAWVDTSRVNETFLNKLGLTPPIAEHEGKTVQSVFTELNIYDAPRFAEASNYLIAGTADPEKLAAEDAVLIIQTVNPYINASKKREQMEITTLKVGDTLTFQVLDENDKMIERRLTVGGILSQSPFGSKYADETLTVIAAKPTVTKLYAGTYKSRPDWAPATGMFGVQISVRDGSDANEIRMALQSIVAEFKQGAQFIDIVSEKREERQFALQMQIYVYGFLIIIGTIGSLNIINTVQTNLLLRRKEIGLLQSVGMTLGQVRMMASAEGVWFGVIGSAWGLGFGALISYFLYSRLNDVQGIPFEFPWSGALLACGIAIAVGLLSVQGPLRKMNKISLIDRLREE